MVPHLSFRSSTTAPPPLFFIRSPPLFTHFKPPPRRAHFPITGISNTDTNPFSQPPNRIPQQPQQQPRTLFPGGYKRPEIKVPTLILHLTPDDVLNNGEGVDLVDEAASGRVGIVVLSGGEGTGKSLYEAACVVKSVVRDRAYFLIAERVDIASAVNASGVLLSDQGLPAIVARNMMAGSKSEAVFLPLVGRTVQTTTPAMNISTSEGVDFLICSISEEKNVNNLVKSVFEDVKIPIFVSLSSIGKLDLLSEASKLMRFGASGFAISFKDMGLFSDGILSGLFNNASSLRNEVTSVPGSSNELRLLEKKKDLHVKKMAAGFVRLEDREKELIEIERSILGEAINVIQKAAPMMEEVSLLIDAVSQIDEPFLLVIVGEFNSGKSTFINALLGERYLKEGVVPTTNEITFLRYSELASDEVQRCERHPDGQLICYLPAPILKEMTIVDTPGTNVILQRQQRLTEEFVPRADLLLFVISADRPLTESEVAFLRYTQQWKKKVVFVLNKSDIYQNADELEEATSFIKENTRKLLNVEHVKLYPVSARSALEAKLSDCYAVPGEYEELSVSDLQWRTSSFYELEQFLNSFLDGSTSTGMERIRLKLETPVAIGEQLISSCGSLLRKECQVAQLDLASLLDIIDDVKEYAIKMEGESISWRRQILSLIATTKSRVMELIGSTLQLSNLDIVATYVFKGEKSARMPATSKVQNDIIGPALLDARRLLIDYVVWLQSSNAKQGKLYKESFERRWPSLVYPANEVSLERLELLRKENELSLKVVKNFSASASSKLFEQEIREVFVALNLVPGDFWWTRSSGPICLPPDIGVANHSRRSSSTWALLCWRSIGDIKFSWQTASSDQ
ncbi:probable transmembrane GTPase FZO-like, chloroplastic isoform X2 [Punica granatum]|uniref:Probable transmembrane GTPase FZO-like, chloroplastic isoform X2 n=1 Tax=Punica granatum TaxID=22663 RepID=A0A6P8DU23_PUNGR|nr:probable transmembrane GTPase FZO-like, chloroplastic isoform X2 [Punica granatum]